MRRHGLLWQIYPPILAVILVALLLASGFSSRVLRHFHLSSTRADLEARALLVQDQIAGMVGGGHEDRVQRLCRDLGVTTGMRLTVILTDGRVVADSQENPAQMDNHAGRPEVREALDGRVGGATRFSDTLRQEMVYVALPPRDEDEPPFVLRTSVALSSLESTLDEVHGRIVMVGLALALAAALVSFAISRRLSRQLTILKDGAARFAAGDLEHRLQAPDSEEIGSLADVLNDMARQLHDRIRIIDEQRNELESVLTSMVEGVLAVDDEDTVISINSAAARLLGLGVAQTLGRPVRESVRHQGLLDLIEEAGRAAGSVEDDLALRSAAGELHLQITATGLFGADGERKGVLLVLNDVTRLRRLEDMRRDFVANVSHELRTPITSIQGFVETLLENPPEDPAERRRFLEIIARQSERLNTIIDDLLCLSRIEQEAERTGIVLTAEEVAPVIEAAVQTCLSRARERRIELSVACPADLVGRLNAPLLEQAVLNLVDNAVKYSEPGTRVDVTAGVEGDRLLVRVADQGKGIPAEHLPRLCERFYRVDKARSRNLGGTGLGLAIVKHITQAHGGEVHVASTVGAGSVFTISLPRP